MGATSSVVQAQQAVSQQQEATVHHYHYHFHYYDPSIMDLPVGNVSELPHSNDALLASSSVASQMREWREPCCYLSPLQTRSSSFASISSSSFPPDPWQQQQHYARLPSSSTCNISSCSMSDEEQVDVVKKVLRSHVNLQASHYDLIHNPIFLAAHYNLVEVLQGVLQNQNNKSTTPGWRQELDKTDAQGFTPLYIASYKGHTQVVKLLLEEGVDVNQTVHSFSPLYVAAKNGHSETVQILLQYKADIMLTDADNNMPYDVASDHITRGILYKAHEKGHGVCAICWQDPINSSYTFLPCNHNILCKSCNRVFRQKSIASCPICRSPIWCRVSAKYF